MSISVIKVKQVSIKTVFIYLFFWCKIVAYLVSLLKKILPNLYVTAINIERNNNKQISAVLNLETKQNVE